MHQDTIMTAEKKQTIIGQSAKLQEIVRTTDLIAGTDVPVLITGDTGTGKDLFAYRIHQKSLRKQRPFVKLNCSSLNASLTAKDADSVIFGAQLGIKKNSFAGANNDTQGLIAKARSGTLFFDNIDELPLELQAKLLHFIETGEIQASGFLSPQKYDVRVIAATHENLTKAVEASVFREDLYYRLNVIPLELPALQERENDIILLIEHFFKEYVREKRLAAPTFSKTALKQLMQYNWPGNIRELKNFSERMFILFSAREIDLANLPQEIRCHSKSETRQESPFILPASGIKLESVEVDLMLQALDKTSGNKSQAARLLGLTRDTFLYRLKKYSL